MENDDMQSYAKTFDNFLIRLSPENRPTNAELSWRYWEQVKTHSNGDW